MVSKPGVPRYARRVRGWALALCGAPDWLARSYGGTDKYTHGYMRYYRRHLGPVRFRKMVIFEIGVGGYDHELPGGSLALWRDYFSRSTIVGLDIAEKTIAFGPRVKFQRADQSSRADLEAAVEAHGRPDVVIDDGSHIGDHVRISFEVLWPLLPSGGCYVIEDLSTSYDSGFGGASPPPETSAIGLLRMLASDVQSRDPTFIYAPESDNRPTPEFEDVAAVHIYPGMAVIEKA